MKIKLPSLTLLTLLVFFSISSTSCLVRQLGGKFPHGPEEMATGLSHGAQDLIKHAFHDLKPESIRDYHVHLLGVGSGNTGALVSPEMQSLLHPVKHMKFKVYMSASGIKNPKNLDEEYVARLVKLIRSIPGHGKYGLLAFDKFYHPDGRADLKETEFYIPNDYLYQITGKYPDLFFPVVSVHPYRKDAVEELERLAKQGIKYVKWLPNAMGIDPTHKKTVPFYEKMKEHGMVLISHTGEEKAVDAKDRQYLGNPLYLRKPLQYGVKVVMAHCASFGTCTDLEDPDKKRVPCFDLFVRMMEEKKYEGLLFGGISALTQYNRPPETLEVLLKRKEWHSRLVNGSDYPLPGVNFVIRTGKLVKEGFITREERKYLDEIYGYNPLLFDFVLKRTLKHPDTGQGFSTSVFQVGP